MKIFCAMFILLILVLPVLYCVPAGEISWLYSFLEDNHPDFFNTVGRSQAEEILKGEMKNADEGQSETETFFSLQRIAAIAHDSHTSVNLTAELFSEMKVYPAVFDFFGEDLIVSVVSSDFEDCLGKTVEQINGTGIDEIIELSRSVVPHDNDVYLKLQLKNNYLSFEDFLSQLGIGEGVMRLSFSDGTALTLEPVAWSDFSSCPMAYLRKAYPQTLGAGSYYSAYMLEPSGALLINYHACAEMPDYPFHSFVSDVAAVLDEYSINTVVIDLRYNSGGNSEIINPLADELKKRDLTVYVLIDEGTFSSAVLNAQMLRDELDAVLAGRPSGGSASHFGEVRVQELPDSTFSFSYSTKYFDSGSYGPLQPDILIEKSVDDYISGTDTDLRALGLI